MIGNNQLVLCEAEMKIAVQQYVDSLYKESPGVVKSIRKDSLVNEFTILIAGQIPPVVKSPV
jgi:hypothetical protein